MNHSAFRPAVLSGGAKEVYAPFRSRCQQLFFNPPKFFLAKLFRAVCSFSRTREAYALFPRPCQLLFAGSAIFSRRAQAHSVPVSREEKIGKQVQIVKPYLNFFQQFYKNGPTRRPEAPCAAAGHEVRVPARSTQARSTTGTCHRTAGPQAPA